jgi:cell division protein FtsL
MSTEPDYSVAGHGILRLDGGNLQLEFSGVGQSTRVENLRAKLSQATAALGGELLRNPLELLPGSQQITAHPLG